MVNVSVDSLGVLLLVDVVPVFGIARTDTSCAFVLVELLRAAAHHKPVWPVAEPSWTCPTGGNYYATECRQWCEGAAQREEAI